ncbi:hypothetical protein BC831DRAFT_503654 [Entophlyctis helioformis]|nr:hypothetical protein BC831DRAFT_503654 [Entophlyctis helioformis]
MSPCAASFALPAPLPVRGDPLPRLLVPSHASERVSTERAVSATMLVSTDTSAMCLASLPRGNGSFGGSTLHGNQEDTAAIEAQPSLQIHSDADSLCLSAAMAVNFEHNGVFPPAHLLPYLLSPLSPLSLQLPSPLSQLSACDQLPPIHAACVTTTSDASSSASLSASSSASASGSATTHGAFPQQPFWPPPAATAAAAFGAPSWPPAGASGRHLLPHAFNNASNHSQQQQQHSQHHNHSQQQHQQQHQQPTSSFPLQPVSASPSIYSAQLERLGAPAAPALWYSAAVQLSTHQQHLGSASIAFASACTPSATLSFDFDQHHQHHHQDTGRYLPSSVTIDANLMHMPIHMPVSLPLLSMPALAMQHAASPASAPVSTPCMSPLSPLSSSSSSSSSSSAAASAMFSITCAPLSLGLSLADVDMAGSQNLGLCGIAKDPATGQYYIQLPQNNHVPHVATTPASADLASNAQIAPSQPPAAATPPTQTV